MRGNEGLVVAMKRSWFLILSFVGGVLLVPSLATGAAAETDCSETATWISAVQQVEPRPAGAITDLSAGRHECYDRLVIQQNGPVAGYRVSYVDGVRDERTGKYVALRGEGVLQVTAHAAASDDAGNPTYDPPQWHEAVDVAGFETFRQVSLLGMSEGSTNFGLGVRERLPFRVLSMDGSGGEAQLVVDVAHEWSGQGTPSAAPFGHLDSVRGVEGGVQVNGWAIDPDTVGPIYVWVTIDGAGRHLYANVDRPDVGAVHPGYGAAHGFASTIPTTAGLHQVCVKAANVGAGTWDSYGDGYHRSLGCRTLTIGGLPGGPPLGNYERAVPGVGGIAVSGWAIDPDTVDPIYVWVTVDGVGRHLLANIDRPDVEAIYGTYGSRHGFSGTVPATPGEHTVCVTASNVGPGAHVSFGCRTTIAASGSPIGNFDSIGVARDGVYINGWAIDPDTSDWIYVWVTIDGVGRHHTAYVNRPDVGEAYPAYGPDHGFLPSRPVGPGTHTVCVTASNVGAGTHTPLGCRTVTVPER